MNIPMITFAGGEMTPLISERSDLEKYQSGCRHLDGFIPTIYGAAVRRPGLRFVYDSVEPSGSPP